MPISFDTSGLQQLDSNVWRDSATSDIVQLSYFDLVPDLPARLTDLATLRRGLAEIHAESGCLVEAFVVGIDAQPALLRLHKIRLPDQPAGLIFSASFTVPKANCSAVLQIVCPETGTTGIREAMLALEIGFENMYPPHPYAPGLQGALPYNVADDQRWDERFPDHPLSRARRWAAYTCPAARLDPNFAAVPGF